MSDSVDLTVNEAFFEDGKPAVALKIQGPMFELNIWMRPEELPTLERASKTNWVERGSVQIGRCGNAPAFWSSDADSLSILIGHDDESWDFGVMLPRRTLENILNEVRAEQSVQPDRREDAAPG